MNYYIGCIKKYAVFAGRARRKEYWMFFLFNFLISLAIGFVCGLVGLVEEAGVIGSLYTLALLLPGIAVTVRRLHDTGRSGWWWWIILIPIVGVIVMLVFVCSDSQPGSNAYGANPKGA